MRSTGDTVSKSRCLSWSLKLKWADMVSANWDTSLIAEMLLITSFETSLFVFAYSSKAVTTLRIMASF